MKKSNKSQIFVYCCSLNLIYREKIQMRKISYSKQTFEKTREKESGRQKKKEKKNQLLNAIVKIV